MRKLVGLATVIWGSLLAVNSLTDETKTFTITGEWIVIGSQTPAEKQKVMNAQHTSVVVSRFDADNDGTSMSLEIASGAFTDGKIVLQGEIDERTEVLISATRGEEEPMTLPTVLIPGTNTSFALLDKDNSLPEETGELLLVEAFRLVEETNEKFMVVGDLNSIVAKDSLAVAYITARSRNPKDGSVLSDESDAVLLQDGRFLIEGIASEPLLVQVWVDSLVDVDVYSGFAFVVVEPGARVKIFPSNSSSSLFTSVRDTELMADSEIEGSMHSKVVESWQNSLEYRKKMEEYEYAIEIEARTSTSDANTEEEQTTTSDSSHSSIKASADVFRELKEIKNSVLTSIAENLDEPPTALLAMELGIPSSMANSKQLEGWDKIASVLDEDVVARRVLPKRETLARQLRVKTNKKTIVAGQMAPDFTLANLDGADIALYENILSNNEIVLINFWASWCGPCITKFPKLKELHATYEDDGFEIVFVSIDSSYDEWRESYEAHGVPGINVGDLNNFVGETPVDYGVTIVPTEFLLQSDGEIIDRRLTMDELEEVLVDAFGNETKNERAEDSPLGE